MGERHAQGAEVPEDGSQRHQPARAEEDVIARQLKGEEVCGEVLSRNGARRGAVDVMARDAVAIGDGDPHALLWLKA
jgi:hypothetical protein